VEVEVVEVEVVEVEVVEVEVVVVEADEVMEADTAGRMDMAWDMVGNFQDGIM
jgi:hypothetical protein